MDFQDTNGVLQGSTRPVLSDGERPSSLNGNHEGVMHGSEEDTSSYEKDMEFLSRPHTSKEEFVRDYEKLYSRRERAQELYLVVLSEVEEVISKGRIDSLNTYNTFYDFVREAEDQLNKKIKSRDCVNDANNPVNTTNSVILACEHNKANILDYVFHSNSKLLTNLLTARPISPSDEDETGHNAFYYAIRSGNIELLEMLINKWPGNYFSTHLGELDSVLSQAYEELKLKNVELSEEVEFFVENKLISLRFFSNGSEKDNNFKNLKDNIRDRIELVLQNFSLLKAEYSKTEKVDEKFLFVAKFIAKNIHVLKRQLKSTYDRLPWEEMEFCLVSFVSSHKYEQEINLFYNAKLNKCKILKHLDHFAKRLTEEKNNLEFVSIGKLSELPKLKREKVVAKIISKYPQFEELYSDYQQIRDIHSLEKISSYIKLALSVDPKEREGQLIITRVLQIIGEYFKNTLESPKLSTTTSELLLLSLPKNTRQVIIDLRNSLSHAASLSKRTDIEDNTDVKFFTGVQSDTKRIDDVITGILYDYKIKVVTILLQRIANSKSLEEIKEIAEICNGKIELDKGIGDGLKITEHDKLQKLIKELSDCVTDKTDYEMDLFVKIKDIISSEGTKFKTSKTEYTTAFLRFKNLCAAFTEIEDSGRGSHNDKICDNLIKGIKCYASKTLKDIVSQVDSSSLKDIALLSHRITDSVRSRLGEDKMDAISRIFCEIAFIVEFGTGDLKWIEELKEKLNERGSFIPTFKQRSVCNITEEEYNNQLRLRLAELKGIFKNNKLGDKIRDKLPSYKTNKKLQTVVEMLVLDIMSILGRSEKHLENNQLFLDDNTPLLTGKCLRNHLAHDNALVDVLLSDSSIAVVLNAKNLISENITKSKKKVGKLVRDDPCKLKDKYDRMLNTINNQSKMFAALEEGNFQDFHSCLKTGADINARSIDLWTPLHFAAKGCSPGQIRIFLTKNSRYHMCLKKDVNGQSPLHIAAAHGRNMIVDLFIKVAGVCVDDKDNNGKTPLHLAAKNGHKDTVDILLKHKANMKIKDKNHYSPLHYAINYNRVDVAKILLEKESNVNDENVGGFTLLHSAADKGYIEMVNLLLKKKANVNAKTDQGAIPLHIAALNGHLEVVNVFILKGADVNCRVVNGCTALHHAIEHGHEKVAKSLIKHGANVNVGDKTYGNTPLHFAALYGHQNILEDLLESGANGNVVTSAGMTPLHLAVENGYIGIVDALLKHEVKVDAKDKNNNTALHYAAENGRVEVAGHLVQYGAKVNSKAKQNLSPLHLAAMKGHKEVVELLITKKAEVQTRDIQGNTPLHAAAQNGSKDIIDLLVQNKAEVDARNNEGMTPLHLAALKGHVAAADMLIKSKSEVNVRGKRGVTPLCAAIMAGHRDVVNLLLKYESKINADHVGQTAPLHVAVEGGYKDIAELLIAKGANVNFKTNNLTPLMCAVMHNSKEIVEVLIKNGANVNAEGGAPLSLAVLLGFKDIMEVLLKNRASMNLEGPDGTLLHKAATRGHKSIVSALLARGVNVNAKDKDGAMPIHLAAAAGHEEVVEVLIAHRTNINIPFDGLPPIHCAATLGHDNVVEVLLRNGAKLNRVGTQTPLDIAVHYGHLKMVKMILQSKHVDINAKGKSDCNVLHVASEVGNLEMVKCLVDKGANINARNDVGSKAIHYAAREGFKDPIEFFLSIGLSVDEPGAANQTPLHYAVIYAHFDVIKFLIAQGADVNAKDNNGITPLHIAAMFNHKDVIKFLLKHGAVYNPVDMILRIPLEMASDKAAINAFRVTEKLFQSVKRNSPSKVENDIKAGAVVNAKNADHWTPLHYAAWKGCEGVVKILLQNEANVNALGSKGSTPLHYAAKFCHLNIVKDLLSHGAIYNAVTDTGKTPSDFTEDRNITNLFKIISESFRKVKQNDAQVIDDLNKISDIAVVKAVMGACNREKKNLVVAAVHSKFSKVDQLKQVLQTDLSTHIDTALAALSVGKYEEGLAILRSLYEIRKQILGPDNPGTLNIQSHIATGMYKQGFYQEALDMLEEIYQKQNAILGKNYKDTLSTRSTMGLVIYRQGNNEKAFDVLQEVYETQKEVLGSKHVDTINTQFHLAIVLERQGKYEEALRINREVYESRKETVGIRNLVTVSAQNNIANVLFSQGKNEESLKMYKEVFEMKKSILGINNVDTLRTLHNIGTVLLKQNKNNEALDILKQVLSIQKKTLHKNHPDIVVTQYTIADVLCTQGKYASALKAYKECLDQRKEIYGPNHVSVIDIEQRINFLKLRLKFLDIEASEVLQDNVTFEEINASENIQRRQNDINIAASEGDKQTVQNLLREGANVNAKDVDGRTPLHFAANNGHRDIVIELLNKGADVTQVTNKGNTPLHTATSKGYKDIIEVLLNHTSKDKLKNFVNAKTSSSGSTSLHVAAKGGYLDVVKSLLEYGANYNIKNKDGKTPVDLSKNQQVNKLLKLIEELFKDVNNGNVEVINKLRSVEPDELSAIMNARNIQGNTLWQDARANGHNNLANKLSTIMKKPNHN